MTMKSPQIHTLLRVLHATSAACLTDSCKVTTEFYVPLLYITPDAFHGNPGEVIWKGNLLQ